MLRQILALTMTFAGIMATFLFWYKIIPLDSKFLEWQRDPYNVWLTMAIWAVLGGISCLMASRNIASWAMKVDLWDDQTDPDFQRAEAALQRAQACLHLKKKPQLGLYERDEVNAFMIGLTLPRSTLALSRGALRHLSATDLEILITRELLHFKSGDVKAIALMQGMIFAFTLYVARMLAFLLGTSLRQTEEEETPSHGVEILVTSALIVLLTLPGALVFWFFSRSSALRADAAAARVFGKPIYAAFLDHVAGHQVPKSEIFSDAFKLQSRPYPAWLAWLSLQPGLALRARLLAS
ncbi:MAG TPA: M48 family metalloprotease [Oligoflexus sp.]|uniref:M48 family metalloprotease n=1 Tax=Oligoflexus sp. TaxID=1971216 RepID=UPI002D345FE4|nr:M48 family metalloprotease [Oligoflexus sp.]HYX37335.1 M48 family metalloprotease [Oligoflexus sp.]